MANMNPLTIETIDPAFEFSAGTVQQIVNNQQWYDLNGKPFLCVHFYESASDGSSSQEMIVEFGNTPAASTAGRIRIQPTSIVGGSASWTTSGGGGVLIPADTSGNAVDVYATWENLAFRYVRFDLGGLGAVASGGKCLVWAYAR